MSFKGRIKYCSFIGEQRGSDIVLTRVKWFIEMFILVYANICQGINSRRFDGACHVSIWNIVRLKKKPKKKKKDIIVFSINVWFQMIIVSVPSRIGGIRVLYQ